MNNDELGGEELGRTAKLVRSMIKMFRILRVLRLFKMAKIVRIIEDFLNASITTMSIGKFVFALLLLAHLVSCAFLAISLRNEGWMQKEKLMGNDAQHTQYIASIYWTFTSMSTSSVYTVSLFMFSSKTS